MPGLRAILQAELEAEAARLIAALWHWTVQTDAPDQMVIEVEVLKLRQQLCEQLAAGEVEQRAIVAPLTVKRPPCGRPMHQKDVGPPQAAPFAIFAIFWRANSDRNSKAKLAARMAVMSLWSYGGLTSTRSKPTSDSPASPRTSCSI